jgi:phosphoribosylamine--glycine ligase
LKCTGEEYKGVLYGGFMLTKTGIKVIEYNARFGDPEVMNVLPIMETDFVDVCQAIVDGTLDKIDVRFRKSATVCKYIVPKEYPRPAASYGEIDVTELDRMASSEPNLRVYYGAVERGHTGLRLTGSRAIGVVGLGSTLDDAERIAEQAASLVRGPVHHRKDIGTAKLIDKRVDHMRRLREASVPEHRTKLAS